MSGPECINANLASNLFRMDWMWIGTQPKQIGKEMELHFSSEKLSFYNSLGINIQMDY